MSTNNRLFSMVRFLKLGALPLLLAAGCPMPMGEDSSLRQADEFVVSMPMSCLESAVPCADTKLVLVGSTTRTPEAGVLSPRVSKVELVPPWVQKQLENDCANLCIRTPLSEPVCGIESRENETLFLWCAPPSSPDDGLPPTPPNKPVGGGTSTK